MLESGVIIDDKRAYGEEIEMLFLEVGLPFGQLQPLLKVIHWISVNITTDQQILYLLFIYKRLWLIILIWNTQPHLLLSNIDSKPYFLIPSHPNHTSSRIRTSINLINLFGTILTGLPNWTTFSTMHTIKNIRRRKLL